MAVQPRCPICGKDLMSDGGKDADGKAIEPQVSYWMHDPRNLHVDVKVTAHKVCYDKIKAVYADFDKPTQNYAVFKIPVLEGTSVVLKTVDDFLKLGRI